MITIFYLQMTQTNLIGMQSINLFFYLLEFYVLKTFLHYLCFSWEAGQVLSRKVMLGLVDDFQRNQPLKLNPNFITGIKSLLCSSCLDKVY